VIRVLLAGGPEETRVTLAGLLRERLGVTGSDGFVLAAPPTDLDVLDAALEAQGAQLDALLHLGGAPEWLLDRYPRAVVEVRSTELDDLVDALREALVFAN
jgi:hypothetical protein